MSRSQYGLGMHRGIEIGDARGYARGRASVINEIRQGVAVAKANQRAKNRDTAAGMIGSAIVAFAPVAVQAWKSHRAKDL